MSPPGEGASRRLLCLGFGYTARALSERLREVGDWRIVGTTRSAEKLDALRDLGIEAGCWAGGPLTAAALEDVDAVLVSVAPDDAGCPAYRATAEAIASRGDAVRWVGYLSSTSVYGDHGGAWVDETSELRAVSPRARRRVAAERQWHSLAERSGVPSVVFRLSGIYGPGRSAIEAVRAGRARRIHKPGQVFSRAHVADIAAVLAASLHAPGAGTLFNVADDEPAPPQDVIEYACALLGVTPPALVPIDQAELSEAARRFYDDNKRVDNTRIKRDLGVRLRYPTYREGLAAILEAAGERPG